MPQNITICSRQALVKKKRSYLFVVVRELAFCTESVGLKRKLAPLLNERIGIFNAHDDFEEQLDRR